MAKIPFSKLKCKVEISEIPVQVGEEIIMVKQYLPIQDKLTLIGKVIMQAHMQDENYSNPVKANVFTILEMVFAYTNIAFTDKQKEDPAKLYDMLKCSGALNEIFKHIPEEEIIIINKGVEDSIEAIYKYQNSVLGILDTIKQDYSGIDDEISDITKKFSNPENLDLIKDILTKIG